MWGEPLRLPDPSLRLFISTHSPRVGRTALCGVHSHDLRISTHSPRVGRTVVFRCFYQLSPISTHSPRVGRTVLRLLTPECRFLFQLTRPVWGEPPSTANGWTETTISTHSPRVGRTGHAWRRIEAVTDFNSLAPCGANPSITVDAGSCFRFQLTRPVWGEPA